MLLNIFAGRGAAFPAPHGVLDCAGAMKGTCEHCVCKWLWELRLVLRVVLASGGARLRFKEDQAMKGTFIASP